MPATPTLVIERSDGTERARLDCITARRTETLVEMWRATATVARPAWLTVDGDFDEITDRFIIERGDGSTLFAGRFADDARDGDTVTVTVESYERDAKDAEPTQGRLIYNNVNDSTVAEDAINSVGTLIPGTVDTGAANVSFTFAHAAQSKVIRDAAEPAGMDIAYRNDRTVDFLTRLGSDKSNIAISNTDQSIVNSLSVEKNSQQPVTHIRGLGAQQGPDQVTAEAVVPSYTSGRQVWREYENKDIVQQDRLQQIVDRLAASLDGEQRRIVVTAEVTTGVDVSIGDRITVDLTEHDINRLLRVVEKVERIGPDPVYELTLTNRYAERGGERKRRDDLNRFNSGDQGFIDRDVDAYGWQPVSGSVNATRPYPYPDDVETEIKAEVTVNSIPYRAYSQGAASAGGQHSHLVEVTHPSHTHDVTHPSHTHDVTHPTHDHDVTHPTHDHDVNIGTKTSANNTPHQQESDFQTSVGTIGDTGGSWTTADTFSFTSSPEFILTGFVVGSQEAVIEVRTVANVSGFDIIYPRSAGIPVANSTSTSGVGSSQVIMVPEDADDVTLEYRTNFDANTSLFVWAQVMGQHTHDVNIGTETSDTALGTTETSTTALGTTETSTTALGTTETSTTALGNTISETSAEETPLHTHDPLPGIIDFPTETASNVDVIVNGTTVATDIGSGTFTETVDIAGELTPGNNTIEVASDSLGLVNVLLNTQLFRTGREA